MNKKKKKRILIGITVGGPMPGIRFQMDLSKNTHVVLLPSNPFYCAAIYVYTKQLTATREVVAIFNHCVPRPK